MLAEANGNTGQTWGDHETGFGGFANGACKSFNYFLSSVKIEPHFFLVKTLNLIE